MFGFECVVYMGAHDCDRQRLNVFRMRMLGAEVVPVEAGQKTLKEAVNEAMRDWVTNVRSTHYILGTAYGAHPYPVMVRNFHRVIGDEARRQILEQEERLPDLLTACVRRRLECGVGLFCYARSSRMSRFRWWVWKWAEKVNTRTKLHRRVSGGISGRASPGIIPSPPASTPPSKPTHPR